MADVIRSSNEYMRKINIFSISLLRQHNPDNGQPDHKHHVYLNRNALDPSEHFTRRSYCASILCNLLYFFSQA